MGLKKQTELKTGQTADYWAITQLAEVDYHARTARVCVQCWASKAHKDNGKGDVVEATMVYYMNPEEFDRWLSDEALSGKGNTLLSQAYAFVKSKEPFFADALST